MKREQKKKTKDKAKVSPKRKKAGTATKPEPIRQNGKESDSKKKSSRRMPSITRIERDVRFVLMDLMSGSESDSVRVAAAKALMDRVNKEQGEDTDEQDRHTKERDDALAEAGRLLAELTASQSFGARRKAKVA
ncbi:MAG: hypothetical protein PHD48_06160 [Alphaproteobacteria bacterium]|nr:hypothetical protein [Alphaproteobacteria bacterium]